MKFNAAFWKWFGDSKVVDSKGNPLVVYRGQKRESNSFVSGVIWLTSSAEVATLYGRYITSAYIRVSNPYIVDASGKSWENIEYSPKLRRLAEAAGIKFDGYDDGTIDADLLAKMAKMASHDGLIIENVSDHPNFFAKAPLSTTYAVFESTQIKSIDNRGTWDADDPVIRSNPPDWAYHVTTGYNLRDVALSGLQPVSGSINSRDDAVVFFGTLDDVLMYVVDREYPVLLRFPWPADATYGHGEGVIKSGISSHEIEAYTGAALDGLANQYYNSDEERRYGYLSTHAAEIIEKLQSKKAKWVSVKEAAAQ